MQPWGIRSTVSKWNVLFKNSLHFFTTNWLTFFSFFFLRPTNNNFSLVEALSLPLLPEFFLAFLQPDTDILICASDTSLSGHYYASSRTRPTRTVPVSHLLFFFNWRCGLLSVAKHDNCSSFSRFPCHAFN